MQKEHDATYLIVLWGLNEMIHGKPIGGSSAAKILNPYNMILITQIIHAHSPTGGNAEKSKKGKKEN